MRSMSKREQERLIRLVRDFVLAHGGKVVDPHNQTRIVVGRPKGVDVVVISPGELVLQTLAGLVHITPLGCTIRCRFDNPQLAAKYLVSGPHGRLSKLSGKWNHHYDGAWKATDAFYVFAAEFKPILTVGAVDAGDTVTYAEALGPGVNTVTCTGRGAKDGRPIINLDDGHWCFPSQVIVSSRKGTTP